MTNYEYIREKLSADELLCQLMEECGELISAANHLRRARNDVNPRKESLIEATADFEEEIADVLTALSAIGNYVSTVEIDVHIIENMKFKAERWKARLKANDTTDE